MMQQVPIDIAISQYINLHRACSSGPTVQYYIDTLARFNRYLIKYDITYCDEISQDKFIEYLQTLRNSGLSNVSVNTYARGIRSWCSWLLDNEMILQSFVKGVKQLRDDSKQVFPLMRCQVNNIDSFFDVNDKERDYIIFHLMLDCGLRRQEVIKLDVADVQHNCLVIRNSKYNKSRLVPLPEFLHDEIFKYRRLSESGPLLLDKTGKRITIDCIKRLFTTIRSNTGINVHPHLLRHTFATSYIMGGGNLEFLRIILGHSSYNVTQRYLHVAAQCSIAAIDIYRLDSCFFKNYNKGGYDNAR